MSIASNLKAMVALALLLGFANISEAKNMADNTSLDARQQSIVVIAAFTASGDIERLKPALNQGLDDGLTVNEIKEIMVQMYAYAGFPRSLNGMGAFMGVVQERKAKGIQDAEGREAGPIPSNFNRDQYGAETRARLAGLDKDISGTAWQQFSPIMDTFLKEHLFADIFARDVLTHEERELATIAALANMKGTEGQLAFHLGAAMNTGLTQAQMNCFIEVMDAKVDQKHARSAKEILGGVLAGRKK